MEKEAYLIPDFCNRYSVSRSTFYREVEAERLQVFKIGRRTLISRDSAEVWFATMQKNSRGQS